MTKKIRFAKIVSTIGPASRSEVMIKKLVKAGADVFRLNFSHGTHLDHQESLKNIRKVEKDGQKMLAVFADLQGPKLRVGEFEDGPIELKKGDKFKLDMNSKKGDKNRVCLPHKEIFAALKKGTNLLINDGIIRLRVDKFGADFAETTVIAGGLLSDRKGVNVPDVQLPISALTEKDKKDLVAALDMGVEYIALSFVQRPEDIKLARELINQNGHPEVGIIAKIEKPSALNYLDEIIKLSDGIMVARGDLGVECPAEKVPSLQKHIINRSRQIGKPVIVATQMLESMVNLAAPTRAEASDVATAVYDGADALMLSAETASGKYPVKAVSIMDKIIRSTESDNFYKERMSNLKLEFNDTAAEAITEAAREVTSVLSKVAAIATYTESGSTTLRMARIRPLKTIICITPSERVAHKMCLTWGVYPSVSNTISRFTRLRPHAINTAVKLGLAKLGDRLVATAGMPFSVPGTTNILYVLKITKEDFGDK